jgi:UDP-N-acetylglucosamine--N-acetylmuramyl-(pentapeptide) pyrophosphoryl-undecaprenol N-acetylglucosamine transferase
VASCGCDGSWAARSVAWARRLVEIPFVKVAFVGGGSGGHLAPGIGVAEVLRQEGHESLFLVAGRTVEHAMLEPRGFASRSLFGGNGDGGRPRIHRMGVWWRATRALRRELGAFDPDVVVVLGGWVALPTVWSGLGQRPTVLIESNARPGKVQRLLGRRVDHACLATDGPGMPQGRRTTRVTGIPTPGLRTTTREEAAESFGLAASCRTLLVTGGSQGARDLNLLVPALRAVLAERDEPWQILHVTGHEGVGTCSSGPVAFSAESVSAKVPVVTQPFVSDMAAAWSLADVAVCRSGAGTVAELASTATPALLIPYPHHADQHQAWNAQPLVDAGAAVMIGQGDPAGVRTAAPLLSGMLDHLPEMAERARESARPEAARIVAEVVGLAAHLNA